MKKLIAIPIFLCLMQSVFGAVLVASPAPQFDESQMDNLLAPIALYPDPLLAQVLPASTFADQIDQAARWLRAKQCFSL